MEKTVLCNLRTYMDRENINIAQLSKKVKVTENSIRGYAKNQFTRIDCQVAIKLCDFFEVEFGQMFYIKNKESNNI